MPANITYEDIEPSTLETIDTALFEYLDRYLDMHVTTNKGWKKVPVIWTNAERAFHTKNNKDFQDNTNTLILPAISVQRTSVVKDPSKKGIFYSTPGRNQHGTTVQLQKIQNHYRSKA